MSPQNRSRKSMRFLVLAFVLGGSLFGYGWYTEKKQTEAFQLKQKQYAQEKLQELYPALNTLHHQRVQFVIDEYPGLKIKSDVQKKLMNQMDMTITNAEELKKILAQPLESDVPDFDFNQFPKEEAWNQYLVSASALLGMHEL